MIRIGRFALGAMLFAAIVLLASCAQFAAPEEAGITRQAQPLAADFTEVPFEDVQTEYAIVTFRSPPAASYAGGIRGLARTKPNRGARFDENSPAVQAYLRHLENEHANFRSFLNRGAPRAEVVAEYSVALNGVAVKLNGNSLRSLRRGPNVKAADFSWLYRPTMDASVDIVSAPEFWADHAALAGNKGAEVNVAVIDSGIDASHPFFDCKAEIPRKVYASGVAFDTSNIFISDHGTHVAGTVAGCENTTGPTVEGGPLILSGIAPEANLFDYNVFPGFGAGYVAFGGSAFSHDIARALEDAVRDGMDVVNMSLGGAVQGPHDFLAEATNATVDAGVVVVTSAGNSGPNPYTVGSPGTAEKAIAVAATTNSRTLVIRAKFDYDGDGTVDADFPAAPGDFDPYRTTEATEQPLVSAADYGDELACTPLQPIPADAVVLIRRGVCAFTTKILNAFEAGAFGALVYNNVVGAGPIAMAGDGTIPIPAVGLSLEAGQAILANLTADTTTSINGAVLGIEPLAADVLADFSSRGPAPFTGIIKPEIAAPGVNILSSVFEGEFALFNGTSMASPHVAGAAALLLGTHPDWSPADVKAALVNSAADIGYDPSEVGNGRLDVAAAGELEFLVSPPTASFGYHNKGGYSKIKSVGLQVTALDGDATCTLTATAGVTVSEATLSATPNASFTVELVDPTRRVGNEEGVIDVTCDGQTVRVPWASYENPPGQP